jgi:hypothetical protein
MPPLRRLLATTLGVLALGVLGGCGDSRTASPNLSRIEAPGSVKAVAYLGTTLHYSAPADWAMQTGSAPLVVTIGSGPALIAIWRYPRSQSQPLPATLAALRRARSALIAAAAARDPTFRVIHSAVVIQGGAAGVELDALETIRGHVRRVRSTHLYSRGAEVVVDEYAPEDLFHAVDRTVFSPLLHSVRVVG